MAAGPNLFSLRASVLKLLNGYRAERRLEALAQDRILASIAQNHCRDMVARGFFSHLDPDGNGPGERLTAAGVVWDFWAENIALGVMSAQDALDLWRRDAPHDAMLLNDRATRMGLGFVRGPLENMDGVFTLLFARPKDA